MIQTLESFQYKGTPIQVLGEYGNPRFIAKEVCEALNISNHRDALTRLDDDEKGVVISDTLGGKQEVLVINEPGLYSLVLRSTKPEAKAFKRWITHEVLPAIRKQGFYEIRKETEQLSSGENSLPKIVELQEEIIGLQKQLLEYKPKPRKPKETQPPAPMAVRREVYRLRESEGLSWSEISGAVGYSRSSCRNYWLEMKAKPEAGHEQD